MLGKSISHYRIVEKLGEGGMGEVYLAEDARLNRRVALKFLAAYLAAQKESLTRFRTEARAIANLNHPNICGIYDIGEHEGRPYLVLEYVQGRSLKEVLEDGPLPLDQALDLGLGLAAGLEAAHAQGIIHRDIKPANILVADDGTPRIVDFGLARAHDTTQITAAGTTLGTMGYMSPEQLRGERVGPEADMWSLGVVLYECVTGQHPFVAASQQAVMHRVLNDTPPAPTSLRSGVSPALEFAILRCLEKAPNARLQTALDLGAALRAARSSSHSGLSAPSLPAGGRRRSWWVAALALVAIVLLAVFALDRLPDDSSSGEIARVAVPGFTSLGAAADAANLAGLLALVQVGLGEYPGYVVVSPEYLREIEGRMDQPDRVGALALAREAGASYAVAGEVGTNGDEHQLNWRVVETRTGDIVRSGVVQARLWPELASRTAVDVSAAIQSATRYDNANASPAIVALGSDDPVAYGHYAAGLLALELGERSKAREEFRSAVERDSTFALAAYELSRTFDPNVEMDQAQAAAALARRHRERLGKKEALLLDAHQLLLDYKVANAIAAYERALALMPDSREALLGLAGTQIYFRHWGPALATAQEGLRYYRDDPEFREIEVAALVQLGRWNAALEAAQALEDRVGPLVDTAGTIADILARQGDFAAAGAIYATELERDPSDVFAVKGVAFCHYGRGDLEQAIATILEFMDGPQSDRASHVYAVENWTGLGLRGYLADAGRPTLPESGPAGRLQSLTRSASTFIYAGLPDRALDMLDPEDDPLVDDGTSIQNRLSRHAELVRAWIATGDLGRAESALLHHRRIVEGDPNLPRGFVQRLLYTSAALELARGDALRAYELLGDLFREGFIRMGTDEIQILELEAAVLEAQGDRERAIQTLEELVSVFGSRTLAHFELAKLYELDGKPADARASYELCLELWKDADPNYPYPDEVRARLAALNR